MGPKLADELVKGYTYLIILFPLDSTECKPRSWTMCDKIQNQDVTDTYTVMAQQPERHKARKQDTKQINSDNYKL